MNPVSKVLFIATVLLCMAAQPSVAQQAGNAQSSPRIRRVTEVTELLRAADASALSKYLQANGSTSLLAERNAADRAKALLSVATKLGDISVDGVSPVSPGVARAGLAGPGGKATLMLGIEAGEPFRIIRLDLSEGDGNAGESPARSQGPVLPAPPAQLSNEQAAVYLDAYFKAASEQSDFSGAALLAHRGKPIYRAAFGLADRGNNTPNTPETRFSIGSINKMFTAVAIAQLVEQKKLSYKDPLSKFVPDFPSPEAAKRIRVEHLLTHSSGLGNYFSEQYLRELPHSIDDLLEVARTDAELAFEPGTRSQYSNTAFVLLGAIIEKASGKDYYKYVRDHILKPAGMNRTVLPSANEDVQGVAKRYDREPGSRTWTAAGISPASPAGSALSTVNDLMKFGEALRTGKLISQGMLKTMSSPKPALKATRYGYGMRANSEGPWRFGHNGGTQGVHAHLEVFPESGYVFVMLTNQTLSGMAASNEYAVLRLTQVTRALLSDGKEKPSERTLSAGNASVAQTSSAQGVTAAERNVRLLEREWLDAYENRDLVAMNRILSDDFRLTFSDGSVQTKANIIAQLKSEQDAGQPGPTLSTEDVKSRVDGENIVLAGRFIQTMNRGGQSRTVQMQYVDTYAKRLGRWQVIDSQLTRIPSP